MSDEKAFFVCAVLALLIVCLTTPRCEAQKTEQMKVCLSHGQYWRNEQCSP